MMAGFPSPGAPILVAGVLFDLDGTLIDYETISHQALEGALQANPIVKTEYLDKLPAPDTGKLPWEMHGAIVGMRHEDWSKRILEMLGVPESVMSWQEYVEEYERLLMVGDADRDDLKKSGGESLITSVQPWPDVEKVLAYFRDELKVPICIATSSPRKCFVAKMSTTAMREKVLRYFFPKGSDIEAAAITGTPCQGVDGSELPTAAHDTILFTAGNEIGRGKPYPDIFLMAAEKLGVDPKKCLVFEDSPHGIQAGQTAGCATVALPDKRFFSDGRLRLAHGVEEPTWTLPRGIGSFLDEVVARGEIRKAE